MAYNNYHGEPDAQQSSYLSAYDYSHVPGSFDHDSQYQGSTGRSRASSSANSRDGHPQPVQQPLKNAIGHAFEKSDAARTVDPDLIAEITEQVKKSVLEEIKASVAASAAASATQAQPIHVAPQCVPPSPASTAASVPPRDVYTPPSPERRADFYQPSPSPEPFARDTLLDENSDTPTPRHGRSSPVNIPTERPSVRPAPAARMATEEYTPIEKMWQRLFESDGHPTPRLGQFLRGLALHLVEDYEPKNSLVISPAKMLRFYKEVNLQDEIYPWQSIFGELSYTALSKIYRDMRCQHHLIQEHPAEQPYIPALTPEGFQEWMTTMILAHPGVEYERVAKAVLGRPISNADDRKERFPKELSRRLFPHVENLHAAQRCAAALSAEGVGPLRKAPSFPPPPPTSHPAPAPSLERERSPYVSQRESKSFDSDDDGEPSGVRIERERKPYTATAGGGKLYDNDLHRSATLDTATLDQRRHRLSTASQGPWAPPSADPRSGSQANTRRNRSPSFSNPGTHSDSSLRDIPSSHYASNLDSRRRDKSRRSTASSFDSQSRSVYDDEDYRGRHGSSGYGYDSRRY